MKLLVFGAKGQLGEEVTWRAARRGITLTALSHLQADIADSDAVTDAFRSNGPTLVINAAGYAQVDRAESEVDAAYRGNSIGPGVLAAECAKGRVPLVHISTDYVFDGTKATPYSEEDPIRPLGVYGQSKAEGEKAVRDALDEHVILRTSWLYGIYGVNFLKTMMRLAREREELSVVADQRGCPTGTADLAEAILTIAPRLNVREQVWGTYHFAGTGAASWHDFAVEIVEAQAQTTGRRPPVRAISTAEFPTPAKRPANSVLDSSRFADTFGFRAADWRERTREVVGSLLAGESRRAS